MGHLFELMPGAKVTFAVKTDDLDNPLFAGQSVRFLASDGGLDALCATCNDADADLLVLDFLKYPPGLVERARDESGRKVLTFHEYADWDGASDLAVNYNTFDGFEAAGSARVLAGPRYCILNRALLSGVRRPDPTGVLAAFGGSDPSAFSATFVERVATRLPNIAFTIHKGPFAVPVSAARQRPSNVRWTGLEDSFFDLLLSARVGVSAAGNSMYEMMYLGLTPLVLAHNEHQAEFARNAARLGACVYCGEHPDVDWEQLAERVQAQHEAPPEPPQRLVDGLGAQRIVERLAALVA
jgi:spore coat polysaccharide biosynthesis predicted glycosyltransferase SpsG